MSFEICISQAIPSARELIDNLEFYGAKINNRPLVYLQTVSLMSGINLTALHQEASQLLGNEMPLLTATIIAEQLHTKFPYLKLSGRFINDLLEHLGYQKKIYGKATRKKNGTIGKPKYNWVLTERGKSFGEVLTGTHADLEHTKTGYHHNIKWFETILPILEKELRNDLLSRLDE